MTRLPKVEGDPAAKHQARCNYCAKIFVLAGATSNILAHLNRHHRAEVTPQLNVDGAPSLKLQSTIPEIMRHQKPYPFGSKEHNALCDHLVRLIVGAKDAPYKISKRPACVHSILRLKSSINQLINQLPSSRATQLINYFF